MDKIYTMEDVINVGKNKKVLVSDLVKVSGEIFKFIKKGLQFDDEVLKEAHIRKIIRDVKVNNVIVMHEEEKNKEKYVKESESLKNILKSLNTIENQSTETFENQTAVNEDTNIDPAFLEEED